MSSTEKQEIPWGDIGEPLADLLRYEHEIGYYEHAGYALLSTVVHETTGSAWQKFLLADDNFAAVVCQVITISDRESKNPKKRFLTRFANWSTPLIPMRQKEQSSF